MLRSPAESSTKAVILVPKCSSMFRFPITSCQRSPTSTAVSLSTALIQGKPTKVTVSTNRSSRAKSIADGLVLGPGEVKELGDVTIALP